MTAKKHEAFGSLLSAAISYIAACEHKTTARVEEELGAVLGVAGKTVQRYKSGVLPPVDHAQDRIRLLAEAIVQRRVGSLGREWLERFLHAARYPAADSLLNELCPMHAVRPTPERVYQNLPAPTYDQFVMREQAFSEVVDGLGQRAAAMLIVGLGGNGKTSLAREVAAHCLQDGDAAPRFDAVVWVSDKDNPGTTNQSTVLDVIARTLDYPGFTQFPHDEKQYEVEQLLRRQRVLLIIDNAETITDGALFTWLLRLPEPSKALITSRERSRILWSSWLVELRGMREDEARTLLLQRLARLRIAHLVHDPAQLEPLLAATGGNPKAITLVAGLLKYERRPLQQIIADLYAARGDLFDDLFSRAWALLDAAGQRILMVMTFFPDSASDAALSATADVTGFDFDRAVERLTDLSLLDLQQADLTSAPRYLLHPLVRAFAGARLEEQPELERTARERWISYYYNLSLQYDADGWDLPYQFERTERDIANFQAVIQMCYEQKDWQTLIEMVLAIRSFWNTRGYFETRDKFVDMALQAAYGIGDKNKQVLLLAIRIRTLCYLGDITEAQRCYQQAQDLIDHITDPDPALVETLNESHIRICFRLSDFTKQLELAEANVASAERRNSFGGKVVYRYYIADYLYNVGEYEKAEKMYIALITASEGIGYRRALIIGWGALAQIAMHKGNLELAEQHLQRATELAQGIKHYRQLAEVNRVQAQLHQVRGNLPSALSATTKAIELFERMGMRRELAEARAELARLEAQMAAAAE